MLTVRDENTKPYTPTYMFSFLPVQKHMHARMQSQSNTLILYSFSCRAITFATPPPCLMHANVHTGSLKVTDVPLLLMLRIVGFIVCRVYICSGREQRREKANIKQMDDMVVKM